jgi:hypothetical protein
MCDNGVNVDQMKLSIAQVAESLGISQTHLEQLHNLADHAKRPAASAQIAQVTVLLGEARAKLEAAVDELEGNSAGPDVTVELV